MKKESKKLLLSTTIVTLLPILVGLLFWKELPNRMATHFDMEGAANGWSSKAFAVFGIPAFCALCNALCVFGMVQEPKNKKYPEKMKKIIAWICPVVSWFCAAAIYGGSLGTNPELMTQGIFLFVGVLFVVLGNYMPKVKQNSFVGIKIPWTYADEENWNKTHRMAGKLWVIGGILMIINAFLKLPWVELIVILLITLIPCIYSYLYSRRKW